MTRIALTCSLLLAAGCGNNANIDLDAFEDCADMHKYMKKMAEKEVKWEWSIPQGGLFGGGFVQEDIALSGGDFAEADGALSNESAPAEPRSSAGSYSETNVQEQGVDEADLMKTDGEHIYVVAGGRLVITRAWPLKSARELAQVEVDGHATGLYLRDTTVAVISELPFEVPRPRAGAVSEWRRDVAGAVVTLIDVSDPERPEVVRETYVSGNLRETRLLGDRLFLVTYEDIQVQGHFAKDRKTALRRVREAPAPKFLAMRADHRRRGKADWDREVGPACDCKNVWASESMSGSYISTVSMLDLTDPLGEVKASAVVGQSDVIYASPSSLYLAYTVLQDTPFWGADAPQDTVLHKFDITADAPKYRASGWVEGALTGQNPQFSLSEQGDVLRIATTDMVDLTSGITTLDTSGGKFKRLDHLGGLAPGETITAARFVGKLAYLVTWELQLGDPLFPLDLSDPRNIQRGGELKITGWSDYLHPMDDDHLLAVGMDNDGTGGFQLAVSLFDVGDMQRPRLADRLLLEAWGSEAQGEHHAFNYFPPTKSLTIPSNSYDGTVLEVIDATPQGLTHRGTVEQPNWSGSTDPYYEQDWCKQVRRSVIMDDKVWALSNAGMTASDVYDPGPVEADIAYKGIDPCVDYGFIGF